MKLAQLPLLPPPPPSTPPVPRPLELAQGEEAEVEEAVRGQSERTSRTARNGRRERRGTWLRDVERMWRRHTARSLDVVSFAFMNQAEGASGTSAVIQSIYER